MSVVLDDGADQLLCQSQSRQCADVPYTRGLVLSAVRRGLALDDPWRHAYLRHRWTGFDGKGHLEGVRHDRRD